METARDVIIIVRRLEAGKLRPIEGIALGETSGQKQAIAQQQEQENGRLLQFGKTAVGPILYPAAGVAEEYRPGSYKYTEDPMKNPRDMGLGG